MRTSKGQSTQKEKRSEEHTSELQSPCNLVCRLLLEKKKKKQHLPEPRRSSCIPDAITRGDSCSVLLQGIRACCVTLRVKFHPDYYIQCQSSICVNA